MRKVLVALVAGLLVMVLAACSGSGDGLSTPARPQVGDSGITVDTPELQAAKAQAGVEDCAPGAGGGGGLPSLTLPCLGGGPSVDLSTLRGPMVISLWQSACGPCRLEMPILQEFHATYGAQVPVLGIDVLDTLPGKALAQTGKRGATYPQLADPGGELLETTAFAKVVGFPYLAFVDADGDVASLHSGAVEDLDELVGLADDSLDLDLAGS